jgi:hypothetical protein
VVDSLSDALPPTADQSVVFVTQFHLFGAATPSGEAFKALAARSAPSRPIFSYSRTPGQGDSAFHEADLLKPAAFRPAGDPGQPSIWVSFAPIWLLAPFLEQIVCERPEHLRGLRALIACSSSSARTKRYAANAFDRDLARNLHLAETQLLATCRRQAVPCCILQPTLIYGRAGTFTDRNLSRLVALMRRLPLLPLPARTGLRQPIHASQLAAVSLTLADRPVTGDGTVILPERLALGGDRELTYRAMLLALQQTLPEGDPARRCRILAVPNRLLFFLSAPLLLRSPKAYEAVLRMGADLAGFTPSHKLLGGPAQGFPVLPLA